MSFKFQEEQTYIVRDLLKVTPLEMLNSPEAANIYLQFDDGVISSTSRECIHARHCWSLYSIFPHQVVSKEHHLNSSKHKRCLTGGVTDTILNDIRVACTLKCQQHGIFPSLDTSVEFIMRIVDSVDDLYHMQRHHAVSLDTLDFINFQHHPKMVAAHQRLNEAPQHKLSSAISECYGTVKDIYKNDLSIRHKPLVMCARSEAVKVPQMSKCVSTQGVLTDVDSKLFRFAILDSFTSGITSIRDLHVESRTAAQAIFFQKQAMQQSEYLTRMLQMVASSMYRVHHGDCGSTQYASITVHDSKALKDLEGIWHVCPKDGTLKPITPNDRHLIRKTIQIRSVIYCQLPDRYGVCSCCYGQLADSLFPTDNIGFIAATELQRIVTQLILSQKHHVESAEKERLIIDSLAQAYLKPYGDAGLDFMLNPNLKGRRVTISFDANDAELLQDIMHFDDLDHASPMHLTALNSLTFNVYEGDTLLESYPIITHTPSLKAYFTIPMLKYLRDRSWSVPDGRNYVVELDQWDYDLNDPIISTPMVQYSTPAHMMMLKEFLTTSGELGRDSRYSISRCKDPESALIAFRDLVRLKIDVNFTHIQTIVLTYLCEDPDNYDYRIPKLKSKGKLVPYDDVMSGRDIAQSMAYEKHYDTFKSKRTYIIDQRHPHPHSNALRG